MHFLIATAGSAGDVHPFIAIGTELARRGHAVELTGAAPYAAAVRGAGLGYHALGTVEEFERLLTMPDLWSPRRGLELILRQLLDHLAEATGLTRALLRPDSVLVGGTLAWQVRLLQDQLAVPTATVHLSPSCILSGESPSVLPGAGWLTHLPPALVRGLYATVDRWLLDPCIAPRLNGLRAGFGLAPVDHVMTRWIHSPELVIAAWPEWFAPRRADWPPRSTTSGFPLWRHPTGDLPVDPALAAFLAAGAPPVGITPGSAMAHGGRFIARALAACRALGRRALVVTPYAEQLPERLAPDAHHARYVPFEWLVPRLAALVHHGGIGTTAQALAAGTPQLIAPFAHDQFDNGARVQRLGAGETLPQDARPARWKITLGHVVDSTEIRSACRVACERIAGDGDAARAIADRLEALGAGARPADAYRAR